MLWLALLLETGASVVASALPATSASAADAQAPLLWRDFRVGMSPETFAEGLRKIDGIKSVEVTKKRKVKYDYVMDGGVVIGSLRFEITPLFEGYALKSITLARTACLESIAENAKSTATALKDKYPKYNTIKVVDENGVQTDTQFAFFNDETRVTISSTTIENPYPRHQYGGTGFVAAANKLGNQLMDEVYNANISACPNDRGRRGTLNLAYSAQAEFVREHAQEETERAAKNKAMKDGL